MTKLHSDFSNSGLSMCKAVRLWPMLAILAITAQTAIAQPLANSNPSKPYVEELLDSAEQIMQSTGTDRDLGLVVVLLNEAVQSGNSEAMRKLAAILVAGDEGAPADPVRAEALLKQAVAGGDVDAAAVDLGDLYMADTAIRSPAKAVAAYQSAVDAGNAGAMRKIAAIVRSGSSGVAPDPTRAADLLARAVALGEVDPAALELGDLFVADTPIQDMTKAVDAYRAAADAGNPVAMRKLGVLLMDGADGVTADPVAAEALLRQAIDGGDTAIAAVKLGDLYSADGALQNLASAAAAYERAVAASDTGAMRKLAYLLTTGGDTLTIDVARAERLLKDAIAGGDTAWASVELGDFYLSETPLKSAANAASAYAVAVDAGNASAIRKLASLVRNGGADLEPNPERAAELLRQAIAGGDASAAVELGDLYQSDTPLKSAAEAAAAYRIAVEAMNTGAMRKLAYILLTGPAGVVSDPVEAERLLKLAVEGGDTNWANVELGDLYQADTPLKDANKAAAAYRSAVEAGNTNAMRKLAQILMSAEDAADADAVGAEALLRQAVEGGDTNWAAVELGDLYMRGDMPTFAPARAVETYQTAVDAGNTSAMRKLAALFRRGADGVPGDPSRAEALLTQAIAAGDTNWAAVELGDLYLENTAIRNPAKAADAFGIASTSGNTRATLSLASLLIDDAELRDLGRARDLLVAAAEATDDGEAAVRLGRLYILPSYAGRDVAQALGYFEQAAKAGNAGANMEIVRLAAIDISEPILDSAAIYARKAAANDGNDAVLDALMELPTQSLIALVQRGLATSGTSTDVDGRFGKQTAAAMMTYCEANAVDGCDGRLVTRAFVDALILRQPAS